MRTRSQNVSPGGFVSLPPPSRRRRTQRRASPSSERDNRKSSPTKGRKARKARNDPAAGEAATSPAPQPAQGRDFQPEENHLSRQRGSVTGDSSPTSMRAGKKRSREETVESGDPSVQPSPTKRLETSHLSRQSPRLGTATEEAFMRHRRRRRLANENGQYYVDRIVSRGKIREARDAAERAAIRLGGVGSPRDPLARHAVLDGSEISSDEEDDIIMTLPRDRVNSQTTKSAASDALGSSWGFRSLLGQFFNFMPKIPSITFGRSGGRANATTAPSNAVRQRVSEVASCASSSRALSSASRSSKESQSDAHVHDDRVSLTAASPGRTISVNKGNAKLEDIRDAAPDEMDDVQDAMPLHKEVVHNTAAPEEMEDVRGALVESPLTPAPEASSDDRSGKKRKREPSPDTIPNPPGCSYGMDLDYFYFDTSDEEEAARITSAQASSRASPEARASETSEPITPKKKKKKVSAPESSTTSKKKKKLLDTSDEGAGKRILKTPSQSKVKSPEKKRKEVRWAEDVVSPKSRSEGSSPRQPATALYTGGQFSGVDDPFTSEARPESRRPASVNPEARLNEEKPSFTARPPAPSTSASVSEAQSADQPRPSFVSVSPSGQFVTTPPPAPPQGRPGFEAYQPKAPSNLRASYQPGLDTGIAFDSSRSRPSCVSATTPASHVSEVPASGVSAVSRPPSSSAASTSCIPAKHDGPSDEELRRIFGDDEDGREAFDMYKRCPSGELENMVYPDPSPVSSRLLGVDLSLPCDADTAFALFDEAFEAFEDSLPPESPARVAKGKQPIMAA